MSQFQFQLDVFFFVDWKRSSAFLALLSLVLPANVAFERRAWPQVDVDGEGR